ncbi:dimethylamine monooxygenase subunit DmmA family protein [Modestobacter sp. SYSU DS0657]
MTAVLPVRRTSVPEWPAQAPGLDLTGRAFLLVEIGPAAAPLVRRWLDDAHEHGRPVQLWAPPRVDGAGAAELGRRLGLLHVGARLAVAGPEADVLAVVALARRVGVLPEEITAFAVAREEIAVFCVHCRTTTRFRAAPGTEVTCPACRLRLEVHEHVSGHHGSYLASAVAGQDR